MGQFIIPIGCILCMMLFMYGAAIVSFPRAFELVKHLYIHSEWTMILRLRVYLFSLLTKLSRVFYFGLGLIPDIPTWKPYQFIVFSSS
jgi:hypothetical protein